MKKIIFIIFIFIYNLIFSQSFTTNPEFPTETDIIEITFNIQELTRKDLVGYTGTLYTHTGVNTNLGNWQYVIGSWGDNNSQPSLTKVSTDVYKITINNPREFYNLTNLNEHISTLNFVLRSSDHSPKIVLLFLHIFEYSHLRNQCY